MDGYIGGEPNQAEALKIVRLANFEYLCEILRDHLDTLGVKRTKQGEVSDTRFLSVYETERYQQLKLMLGNNATMNIFNRMRYTDESLSKRLKPYDLDTIYNNEYLG
jgi:hypothetical protein